MAKKLGFFYSDSNDKEDDSRREFFDLIYENISKQYAAIGDTSDKVYKTSDELIYDLSNIVSNITPMDLAHVMRDVYRIEHIAGVPYWVLYEKNPLI